MLFINPSYYLSGEGDNATMINMGNLSELLRPLEVIVGMPPETLEYLERLGAKSAYYDLRYKDYFFLKEVGGRQFIYYSPSLSGFGTILIDDGD
jgi:hypothetical protein